MTSMSVIVASDIHRDELFAEIQSESVAWAEVAYGSAHGELIIRILPNPLGENYVFDLTEMQDAVERAKHRMLQMGPPSKDDSSDGEVG